VLAQLGLGQKKRNDVVIVDTYFRQVLAGMVEAGELGRQGVAYRPAVPATEATFGPGELGAEPPR